MCVLLAGAGTGGAALRDLASEAAVGANRPDDGVLGRLEVGVFDLEAASGRTGALALTGAGFVTGRLAVAPEAVD